MMTYVPPEEVRKKLDMVCEWVRKQGHIFIPDADLTKAPPEIQKAWAEYQEWEVKSGTKAFKDTFSS